MNTERVGHSKEEKRRRREGGEGGMKEWRQEAGGWVSPAGQGAARMAGSGRRGEKLCKTVIRFHTPLERSRNGGGSGGVG